MRRQRDGLPAAALLALAAPTTASAGCQNCYVPPQPCYTCYQQQVIPPQYRTYNETVMVSPGRTIAHRTPAQYQTVMVPKTVQKKVSVTTYQCTTQNVVEQVPVCKTVCVNYVD